MNEKSELTAIEELQGQIKKLKVKIKRQDEQIEQLQVVVQGMDCTKEKREEVRRVAEELVGLLFDAEWASIEAYQLA